MKFYKVQIITADTRKHIEFTSAKDEMEAMDKAMIKYKNRNIIDIKVV